MPMLRAMRLANALQNGALTPEELDALLTDSGRLGDFRSLLKNQEYREYLVLYPLFISTAFSSAIALSEMLSDPDFIGSIFSSRSAVQGIADSVAAKMAVFNNDPLLDALAGSQLAIDLFRLSSAYLVTTTSAITGTSSRAVPGLSAAGKYIVLGASTSDTSTGRFITINTARPGTSRSNSHFTNAESVSSNQAKGHICCPVVAPFSSVSDDASSGQAFSFGLLRCDA